VQGTSQVAPPVATLLEIERYEDVFVPEESEIVQVPEAPVLESVITLPDEPFTFQE